MGIEQLKFYHGAVQDFCDTKMSFEEAEAFLERFKKEFNEERLIKLISNCKQEVTRSIVTPFGLKKVVATYEKTGVSEGTKMGTQQALGLLLTEFFAALFDEIIDIYKNGYYAGFDDDRFFAVLQKRILKIKERILKQWQDVAVAFKDGFLSGFLSNLTTTVINAFVTTGKRVVRIIREGLFSLFRAIKILLFPPEGLTFHEAMHEAKKLIATGLMIGLGVIAEEWVDALIKGSVVLEPFADTLTAIFVGALTGLSITMVVYYIDKKKNDKAFFDKLVCDTHKKFEAFFETIYLDIRGRNPVKIS